MNNRVVLSQNKKVAFWCLFLSLANATVFDSVCMKRKRDEDPKELSSKSLTSDPGEGSSQGVVAQQSVEITANISLDRLLQVFAVYQTLAQKISKEQSRPPEESRFSLDTRINTLVTLRIRSWAPSLDLSVLAEVARQLDNEVVKNVSLSQLAENIEKVSSAQAKFLMIQNLNNPDLQGAVAQKIAAAIYPKLQQQNGSRISFSDLQENLRSYYPDRCYWDRHGSLLAILPSLRSQAPGNQIFLWNRKENKLIKKELSAFPSAMVWDPNKDSCMVALYAKMEENPDDDSYRLVDDNKVIRFDYSLAGELTKVWEKQTSFL